MPSQPDLYLSYTRSDENSIMMGLKYDYSTSVSKDT